MVEANPPEFMGAECYTFEDFRQAFGSTICVQGVVGYADLKVTAAGGASVDVSVAAGEAWVEGSLNGAQGMYRVYNDASVALTIGANGAGSSRIDLIIASVYDSQYIGAANNWAIEIVQGTAGAGVPAVPASTRSGYVILGAVTVPASGGTPSVVDDSVRERMSTCGTAPFVDLRASAATSVGNNAWGKITLATEYVDDAFFTVASSVVTVTYDGLYDMNGAIFWEGSSFSYGGSVSADGAPPTVFYKKSVAANVAFYYPDPTALGYFLAAGSKIQLSGFQNSGGSLSTTHGTDKTARLYVRKVG